MIGDVFQTETGHGIPEETDAGETEDGRGETDA